MSKFEFPKSINSRPVYATFEAKVAPCYLFLADAEGAEAILELAASAPELFEKAQIIFIPKQCGQKYIAELEGLNTENVKVSPSYEAAKSRLKRVLSDARVGLQVYLSGTESLMGQAVAECQIAGIPLDAIQCEHRGSVARRMQCVHCKGFTEDVTTDPFVCSHCGLNLFVRDHYSRRLAAFQGVCVDAEDPGNIPESVEIYP